SSQPARTISNFASTSWALALQEPPDSAPRSLSTSAMELFAIIPLNLRFGRSLTDLVSARQDGRHENTILSPIFFRRGVDRVDDSVCDDSFGPRRALRNVDQLLW